MKRVIYMVLALACPGMWIGCEKQKQAPETPAGGKSATSARPAPHPSKPAVTPPDAEPPASTGDEPAVRPPGTQPPASTADKPAVKPPGTQPPASTVDGAAVTPPDTQVPAPLPDPAAVAKEDVDKAMAMVKEGKYREALGLVYTSASGRVRFDDNAEARRIRSDAASQICLASAQDGVEKAMALAASGKIQDALNLLDTKAAVEGNHPEARKMLDDAREKIEKMVP